jgi:hypothetical protein
VCRLPIDEGFEVVAAIGDEIHGIVAWNWPHMAAKLPPEEERNESGAMTVRLGPWR